MRHVNRANDNTGAHTHINSLCACQHTTVVQPQAGPVLPVLALRMPELTGRQVRLLGLKPQDRVQTCGRCCRRSAVKRKRVTCAAYRSELEHTIEQGEAPARSRLLSARRRQQHQEPPPSRSRLFRRTQTPPLPEPEEKAPRAVGRLLQRSQPIKTASNGLTRVTDTVRRAQQDKGVAINEAKQTNAKHKQSDRRNVLNNPRFSQEAGKLSQKDWQVPSKQTRSLTRLLHLYNMLMFAVFVGYYRLARDQYGRRAT